MTTRAEISQRALFAVILIPVFTFGAILTIASFLEILGKHYEMSDAALGRLAAAEYLAGIAGTFLTNNESIGELARWTPWSCALSVVANAAGVLLVSRVPLILFHPLGAFGAAVCYGYALKVIDRHSRASMRDTLGAGLTHHDCGQGWRRRHDPVGSVSTQT